MKNCINYFKQNLELNCRILDLGCGDLNFARSCTLLGLNYTGVDLKSYKSWKGLKNVIKADIIEFDYENYDLIFCRDVMIHLTNAEVLCIINKIRLANPQRLYATTYEGVNNRYRGFQSKDRGRALDLTKEPFMLPEPDSVIQEHENGKLLGIWSKYE